MKFNDFIIWWWFSINYGVSVFVFTFYRWKDWLFLLGLGFYVMLVFHVVPLEGSKATNIWCWLCAAMPPDSLNLLIMFLTVSLQTHLLHCPNLSQGGSYEGSQGVCWINRSYFHRDKCQKCCQCGGALSENKWVSCLYCMLRLFVTVCLHIILNFSRHCKYTWRKAGEAAPYSAFPVIYHYICFMCHVTSKMTVCYVWSIL